MCNSVVALPELHLTPPPYNIIILLLEHNVKHFLYILKINFHIGTPQTQ
jgi:hypothetical protein